MAQLQGFMIVKEISDACSCTRPNGKPSPDEMKVAKLALGTVIECPKCGAQYEWKHEQRDGYYWQKVS